MIFQLSEFIDILVLIFASGYIFKDSFKIRSSKDPLDFYIGNNHSNKFFDENFKNAVLIIAPAIIIHEFFHKFFAMGFGLTATFHTAYTWLVIALVLKLLRSKFIFLVPAFVSITGYTANSLIAYPLIAFAGPLANLIMYIIAYYISHKEKLLKKVTSKLKIKKETVYYFMLVNKLLFFLNMLPLPGFDGYKVFSGLFNIIKTIF